MKMNRKHEKQPISRTDESWLPVGPRRWRSIVERPTRGGGKMITTARSLPPTPRPIGLASIHFRSVAEINPLFEKACPEGSRREGKGRFLRIARSSSHLTNPSRSPFFQRGK